MPQFTTGRKPLPAAPSPIPVKAASEIGVKRTRRSPNLFSRTGARTVPNVITRSSRSISSIIASSSACVTVISRTGSLLFGEHVDQEIVRVGIGAFLRELDRRGQIALHAITDRLHLGRSDEG